ncbi:hypothetical protein [Micromonospora sp. KC721]|uniref:hypothetical protein n=1 Tax=Micromonospora sp. KC721 TaxID=2530380 RepID=UPI001050E37C|nr:hypothetical protein [Micromonospora sp. KC721]TDB81978.1 hypothetical protein E1182_03320 [Micromonospora sp. KC721]
MTDPVSYVAGSRLIIDGRDVRDEVFSSRGIDELVIANGSRLSRVTFRGLGISYGSLGAGVGQSSLEGCLFDRCRMHLASIGRVGLKDCRFERCRIKGWLCLEAEFTGCWFGAKLERVVFDAGLTEAGSRELGRSRNRFGENDFSASEFRDVAFRGGVELTRELLPQTPGGFYFEEAEKAYGHVCRALEGVKLRDSVGLEAFLRVRLDNAMRGQRQDYVSPLDVRGAVADPEAQSFLRDSFRHVGEEMLGEVTGETGSASGLAAG